MSSRDANSKQAASEASNIFSSHYPEMLVSLIFLLCCAAFAERFSVQEVLCQRTLIHDVDFLAVQAYYSRSNTGKDVRRRNRSSHYRTGSPPPN